MSSLFKKKVFDVDQLFERFSNWLMANNEGTLPDSEIVALNFGIFQTKKSYSIYLIGSKSYDPNDDDWACNEDFVPSMKYFEFEKHETIGKDWVA